MKFPVKTAAIAALFAAGAAGECALSRINPAKGSASDESLVAVMGGFRSVAAEIVWFRTDWLQERGRFSEIAQLAAILSFLEPHVPEVWTYSAWNLAYNISIRMPREEDRWPWVEEAVSMLRDRGLEWNPDSIEIYREIVSLFMLKLGGDLDSAAPLYRARWKSKVEDVQSRSAWSEIGMDPSAMARTEAMHGSMDWTSPFASAVYWADRGRESCGEKGERLFTELARENAILYRKKK